MSINRSNIKLQVTRGNKMKMKKRKTGGSFPDVTGDNKTTMKDVLVKRGVLEKKGDKFVVAKKQKGGVIKAQSGTGKDPILSKEERSKEGMKPKPGTKGGAIGKRKYKGLTRKPLDAFRKPIRKRKGGGMAYQLYGGSTKNISNGNKFIQSFYDKDK